MVVVVVVVVVVVLVVVVVVVVVVGCCTIPHNSQSVLNPQSSVLKFLSQSMSFCTTPGRNSTPCFLLKAEVCPTNFFTCTVDVVLNYVVSQVNYKGPSLEREMS